MKNKSTYEGREFWTHVEHIAEEVRKSPQLFNHKIVAPLNRTEEAKCQATQDEEQQKK